MKRPRPNEMWQTDFYLLQDHRLGRERFFNKLKHFRRVATRYDKLLANFMSFVKLAAIAIWLRYLNRQYALALRRIWV